MQLHSELTHTYVYQHTPASAAGNTAASVSCGRFAPNDWNPEGSGSHDEEGLGVVGCQHDASVSECVSVCMFVSV